MRLLSFICAFCVLVLGLTSPAARAVNPDWTTPLAPFRIADNLYYVGSRDLAAFLVTTPAGNILINANYTSSPPQIRHAVEQLGFRWKDTRMLLISHAHVDHAGGAAEILHETGAKFAVMEGDVDVMESGGKTDFAFGRSMQFPPAHVDRVLQDGEMVSLGGMDLVAHKTAGHTRGDTTWTMRVHLPGEAASRRRSVVIVGSVSVLAEYRLLEVRGGVHASYPGIAQDYTASFAALRALPCDIFLASHGSLFDMLEKRKRMNSAGDGVWVDPEGYTAAIADAQKAFEAAYRKQLAATTRR